ncbi:translation initiation factor IF-2-like isoform X2 [Phacochoerus africanus]|uniref:translation initiation factor IF-2-like isoform X2 n=1 Tax=Phacochoerus africanus TaxID=41426 RepID=UPI001FD93081|nr:translation initiation factor IF-2-like isoform X2 [Phacochoerus africanus]
MLPGGGWGRGRPTSAESAAPAAPMSPCPLPGKDAGGGGRGVRGSLRGAVRRLGIFWKVAPAGAGPPGSERVRGRAFPEERALPDNTEDGEAGGRPARREGSGSLLKALSQHGASACHPPSSNQAPQGQGPLKERPCEGACGRGRKRASPRFRHGEDKSGTVPATATCCQCSQRARGWSHVWFTPVPGSTFPTSPGAREK